jgi:type III pantothenate kinase
VAATLLENEFGRWPIEVANSRRSVGCHFRQIEGIEVAQNILAVDVGNSRAKFGIFERTDAGVRPVAISVVSLRHQRDVARQIAEWAPQYNVEFSIAAGSNPPILNQLIDDWPDTLPVAMAIRSPKAVPVTLAVDQPDAVGLDRALNALAVSRLFPQQNAIVIDSGTTTTVDVVSADGVFCGGTIFPGLRLSAYALHDYTAKLPLIDVDAQQTEPPQLPGKNTDEAMRAGLFWGQLGAIREIVRQLSDGYEVAPMQVLTGGGSRLLGPHLDNVNCIAGLPLHGLAMLVE